jgi:O-antigen biosynthesis protein WbqP
MKRLVDILVSGIGLVASLPLLLALGIAVKMSSPGPALFRQVRVGRHGVPFVLLKLRSMGIDAPNRATHEVPELHVTRLGKVLRRTKLDELPQLWNVLVGDMSLIGPRPCLPSQTELVRERAQRGCDRVRPGISGLAQVYGVDMSNPRRLAAIDALYVRRQSLRLDLWLLLVTLGLARRPKPTIRVSLSGAPRIKPDQRAETG